MNHHLDLLFNVPNAATGTSPSSSCSFSSARREPSTKRSFFKSSWVSSEWREWDVSNATSKDLVLSNKWSSFWCKSSVEAKIYLFTQVANTIPNSSRPRIGGYHGVMDGKEGRDIKAHNQPATIHDIGGTTYLEPLPRVRV
jgi:hypothetical protein